MAILSAAAGYCSRIGAHKVADSRQRHDGDFRQPGSAPQSLASSKNQIRSLSPCGGGQGGGGRKVTWLRRRLRVPSRPPPLPLPTSRGRGRGKLARAAYGV